jgi:hypothetical protein
VPEESSGTTWKWELAVGNIATANVCGSLGRLSGVSENRLRDIVDENTTEMSDYG